MAGISGATTRKKRGLSRCLSREQIFVSTGVMVLSSRPRRCVELVHLLPFRNALRRRNPDGDAPQETRLLMDVFLTFRCVN
jgi:hypothetical protein